MRRGQCHRHGRGFGPCSCGLAKLSRLVEPTLLLLLAQGEARYGYELLERAQTAALTDSQIDAGAVYRTLRAMEGNGCVISHWEPGAAGPSRRIYELTPTGRQHLQDWATVLERRSEAMREFASQCRSL